MKNLKELFNGKKILVTGATGTIGRELVIQLVKYKPSVIRIYSRDESKQHDMQRELGTLFKGQVCSIENICDKATRYLIGDIRDEKRLRQALKDIDIVFHTAAMKHVLACEYNPFEALKTNVLGTQNLIEASLEEGVKMVIYTSSDKAVNPANAMGASKLFAEKLVTSANYYKGRSKTCFFTVRFGNVLGSNGSFALSMLDQISRGGPVTLTDAGMTRFVMSIQDAVHLILKAVGLARGGEVFILKMPCVRIKDLIEAMVSEVAPIYGYSPNDIKIKKIGVFPGEKLYEELLTEEECMRLVETEDLFIITPQLKDLVGRIQERNYGGRRLISMKKYSSRDKNYLGQKEIRAMLLASGLIDKAREFSKCAR